MSATRKRLVRLAALLLGAACALSSSLAAQADDPDELYRHRDDLAMARRAADLWAPHMAADFDAAWKLARVSYWIGTQGLAAERRPALDRGVAAARSAIKLEPNKPEGHFWLAANLGAIAEASGIMAGLRTKGEVKAELERVIAIQPDWQDGSAECALARWYFVVPGLGFGGSKTKAEQILRGVLAKHPDSSTALVFLADVLIDTGRKDEARKLLYHVLDNPVDPDWAPEDRDYKKQASQKLQALDRK